MIHTPVLVPVLVVEESWFQVLYFLDYKLHQEKMNNEEEKKHILVAPEY